MALSDSDRILSAGKTVTFKDGSEHVLRFEFIGMKYVEDEMGGLFAALKAFGMELVDGQLQWHVDQTLVFTTVAKALACGLAHEKVATDKQGRLRLPDIEDVKAWVYTNADAKRVNEYAQAGFEALIEAIPGLEPKEQTEEAHAAPDPPPIAPPASTNGVSHGATSTTSPQSDMAVLVSTSGG